MADPPCKAAPAAMHSSFRLDEGFSEDTRSQSGSEATVRADSRVEDGPEQVHQNHSLPEWILGMNESDRSGAF
jgi:F-box and WD-40 domain protein 1/11